MPKGVYDHSHLRRSPVERLWERVTKTTGCWVWRGTTNNKGYGMLGIGRERQVLAHRVAWESANGHVPDGMFVCHKCDNPRCVRPDHLFLGTNSDNIQDSIAKGRFRRGFRERNRFCVNGHEFTPRNTYFLKSRPGTRLCKMCRREKYARWAKNNPTYHRDWKRARKSA